MDMRKALPTMAKAALALLLAWGGMAHSDAQVNIVEPQSYTKATSSDWEYTGEQKTNSNRAPFKSTIQSGDVTHGNYVKNYRSSSKATKPGSFKKDITPLNGKTFSGGYADEAMTQKGYIIEFDFLLYNSQNYGGKSESELIVATEEPTADTYYTGSNYVFALSIGNTNSVGAYYKWYVNDLENSSTTPIELQESWYHLKLVVTEGKCEYFISSASSETNEILYQGYREVTGIPEVKCIWNLVQYGSKYGYLYFDEFKAWHYEDDPAKREATVPTINWKETNEDGVVYTISCKEGEKLYYQLPGQTDWKEATASSVEVTATQGGALQAYTTYTNPTTKAETDTKNTPASTNVVFYNVDISTDSGLCSFSAGTCDVFVPKDVSIYVIEQNESDDFNSNTKTVSLKKMSDFDGGVQFIPSGEGVFLYKANGGNVNLPYYKHSGETTLYDNNNVLQGSGDKKIVWVDMNWSEENTAIYCLRKGTTELAYVKPYTSIPANKAYLRFDPKQFNGSKLSLVFDDDATGIDGVKAFGDGQNAEEGSERTQGALYNLAGQRVDDAYKGIVVQNGRKYMKK